MATNPGDRFDNHNAARLDGFSTELAAVRETPDKSDVQALQRLQAVGGAR